MTPAELRSLCDSLNPGGQTKLAGLLGWTPRTMRNKLAGKTKITLADELAIRHITACSVSGEALPQNINSEGE